MEAKLTIFLGGYAMLDLLSLFWNLIKNLYTKILIIRTGNWCKNLKLIPLKKYIFFQSGVWGYDFCEIAWVGENPYEPITSDFFFRKFPIRR